MNRFQLEKLSLLRCIVGYLGEKEQHSWWQSMFFNSTSRVFLTPVFAQTHVLVQYNGVVRAAALTHDERIGVGNVYHLFRLPEDFEQNMHRVLHDTRLTAQINDATRDKSSALIHLQSLTESKVEYGVGPTRVGSIHQLHDDHFWHLTASLYYHAFSVNDEVYPYFTNRES